MQYISLFEAVKKVFALMAKFIRRYLTLIYLAVIIILSYLTYVVNYDKPAALFWDENYHIASSEKYINGVFFMEPHPPLGKLLIAVSESFFSKNKNLDKSNFVKTDHIKNVPQNYSFCGVRFPSVILAFFSAMLFFFILYSMFDNPHLSFFFSF